MDEKCKLCKESMPTKAIYRLNVIALRHGFCSWICLSMSLGHARAMSIIDEDNQKEKRQ